MINIDLSKIICLYINIQVAIDRHAKNSFGKIEIHAVYVQSTEDISYQVYKYIANLS